MGPLLLGIRHHGPGSARAVRRALSAYQPQVVLIEGPPEADPLVALAGDEEMRAPVALLAYPAGAAAPRTPAPRTPAPRTPAPRGPAAAGTRAAFWPFGEFSPEWQALRWAVAREVPVRFVDLPAAVRFAAQEPPTSGERVDPLGALAAAAGYDDPERWWEDVVEHRSDAATLPPPSPAGPPPMTLPPPSPAGPPPMSDVDELAAAVRPFAAIAEAMAEVRALQGRLPEAERVDEERREAAMRAGLRAAMREHERVAVVCGAWHLPALTPPLPTATADARVLRGLPKVKVAVTWVPWTHARLASGQGYGAGVRSPGWYHHLFVTPPAESVSRWLVRAAGVLRRDGLPISSADVIEATRLAEALATMRGRPVPGLTEVTDAALAVLCEGDLLRLELVQRRLVVGERLGAVPQGTPGVPIARDVAAAQRRLRLPPDPQPRDVDLDLRRDFDLERSRLLHRLGLLGVDWGVGLAGRRGRGTFWESWRLAWQPEFAVDLVEASAYGTTVRDAANARVAEQAATAGSLADVTALVERCLLAELPDSLPAVLRTLDDRMARDHDVAHLMEALPALARTVRYGDVRRTDLPGLRRVTEGMVTRVCVGLPAAVTALDDAAAAAMRDRIDAVHAAVGLLEPWSRSEAHRDQSERPADIDEERDYGMPDLTARWHDTLAVLSTKDDVHGLLAGRLNWLLLDTGRLDADEAGRRMGLVLTAGVPVARAAAWIEGFLTGDGLLLVHDEQLLRLVDGWLTGIPADAFVEVLPLLRRTFSEYPAPQRRQIGERAVRLDGGGGPAAAAGGDDVDDERGELVLPTVAALLGFSRPPAQPARPPCWARP